MSQETVSGYKGLELRHSYVADTDIINLLSGSVLGTEGGLRYSVKDMAERMKEYGNSLSFITLYKKNTLTGLIGLCNRRTTSFGREFDSVFLRYLSFRKSFQISKVSRRQLQKMNRLEDNFKQQIFLMFSSALRQMMPAGNSSVPHLAYAIIESENERSRNFARQAGYEPIRSVQTIAFSRLDPKPYNGVRKLMTEEKSEMVKLLKEYYSNYTFFTESYSFIRENYYILKQDGEISAGISVLPTTFRIREFPGLQGWVMLRVIPWIPYLRRLVGKNEFRFLVLDSLYCKPGLEYLLPDLFESVCALEKQHSAVLWLDDQTDLFTNLTKSRRMGFLGKVLSNKPGLVFASFSNVLESEKRMFLEKPVYIAGLDLA